MDGHPIPRQITTFEFKLIGFLTLHQFIYLILFLPLGFIAYKLFPIPLLNVLVGVVVGGIGPCLAFVPINDRPMEAWIRNFLKRLTSATQYIYHKENKPLPFFSDLFFVQDPHRVLTHIESQEKLAAYLAQTQKKDNGGATKKQGINILFHTKQTIPKPETLPQVNVVQSAVLVEPQIQSAPPTPPPISQPAQAAPPTQVAPPTQSQVTGGKHPFITGVIKNHKLIPIPGILIYVKDGAGKTIRLLKSNPHGVFATFSPLVEGEYEFELKDPRGGYFFDTMKLPVLESNPKPIEFYSKELI